MRRAQISKQLWDVIKDTEGFANGLFESIENLRKTLPPGFQRFGMTFKRSFRLVVAHCCSLKQPLLRGFRHQVNLRRWYWFFVMDA